MRGVTVQGIGWDGMMMVGYTVRWTTDDFYILSVVVGFLARMIDSYSLETEKNK